MTTISMTDVHARQQAAQADFDRALAALATARRAFEDDAGKAYAEHLQREQALHAKIATHGAEAEAAQARFKQAFAAAGFEKTKAVKDALFSKNDAEAIAEVLREALHDSELAGFEMKANASVAAMQYAACHDTALECYAQLEVWNALVQCGEPLAKALALVGRIRMPSTLAEVSDDPVAYRRGLAWKALQELADGMPEATEPLNVPEVGALALGTFADRKFMTLAQLHQDRVTREREQVAA